MIEYDLPYKYELEYVHLDGKAGFHLGESLMSTDGLFSVKYKYDPLIAGLVVVSYGNGSNNVYDIREPSSYVHFKPDTVQTTARNFVGITNGVTYFDTKCGSESSVTSDTYCGRNISFFVTGSEVSNQKVIGHYATVYLNKGERLCIYGCCDDTLFIRLNGEQVYFKYSDDAAYGGSPGDFYHYFHGWAYTAPESGYYELEVIGANHAGLGGATSDGTSIGPLFRMTLAPAGAKYTEIPSTKSRPSTGNTTGDICRVVTSTTSGSKTYSYFYEYIWNGKSWTTQKLGNVNLSEPRFFVPDYCTLLPMYPYGYSATIGNTGSTRQQHYTNTLTSNFSYGNKTAKNGSVSEINTGDLTVDTTISYYGGSIYQNDVAVAQADSSAKFPTSKTSNTLCVGHLYTGYTYHLGLVGNLYGATLNNKTSTVNTTNEWYPVMTSTNVIKLYNLNTGKFVNVTKKYSGTVLTPGPISHAHDKYFVTKYGYQMPYDHEVECLVSNGNCWFGDGMYPDVEKDKPYVFYPHSEFRYCVIDNFGNPCLYDRDENKFYYNQGVGKLFGKNTVHTNDHFFQSEPERIRDIPGSTVLLTGTDVNYAYKMEDSLPDPNVVDSKVAIPTKAMDGFSEGQVVIARKYDKSYRWTTVTTPTEGVGVPTAIRSSKIGNKVNIRWKDPTDTMDPTATTVIRKWKYTRLVRKTGSYPKSPYDGVVVVQNSVRNYYNDNVLIDNLPPNINGIWYYKLFAFSDDNVVSTSSECQFTPFELDWSKMSSYIQTGKASAIFGIGDEIVLSKDPEFSGVDTPWNDLTFVVAGFDEAKPTNTKLTHSVTLVSKILPFESVFDKAWGSYRLVTSGKADKNVDYYVKYGTGYKKASPQPAPGTNLTADMGYYVRMESGDSRISNGSNRWNECELRKWLSAVALYSYALSKNTTAIDGKNYYKLNGDGTYELVNPAAYVNPNPSKLGWYERGDAISYVLAALPPLLAIKQLDAQFYNCVISTINRTAVSASNGSGVDTTEDRVVIPSYTQLTGSPNGIIEEGKQINLFTDPSKLIKRIYGRNVPNPWWTRSPNPDITGKDHSTLKYVSDEGEIKETTNLTGKRGVCLVIMLG